MFLPKGVGRLLPRLRCKIHHHRRCIYSTPVDYQGEDVVSLMYDDYDVDSNRHLAPLLICHGMLGSRHNWTSIAKQIHKQTGRRVLTVDARNHGDSPHTDKMTYQLMAGDLLKLVQELKLGPVALMGHSMGGRTVMMLSNLQHKVEIKQLIVVDVSPINQEFDVTSSNEWNMEHYFHCLKAVKFDQTASISKARKDADQQLSVRIPDANLRAWLLMNMRQDPKSREIGWRINVNTIHAAFKSDIATISFPQDGLSTYSGPCLFIGGADSDYIPVADHDQIRERFTQAEFCYVPKAGHWVHSQNPAGFLQAVLPVLNQD